MRSSRLCGEKLVGSVALLLDPTYYCGLILKVHQIKSKKEYRRQTQVQVQQPVVRQIAVVLRPGLTG